MRVTAARLRDDRGDVVIGWLTRLLVVVAIVGVALIDGVSLLKAHYGADGDADVAASKASAAYAIKQSKADAYAAAVEFASLNDEFVDKRKFHVDAGGAVTLTLTRTADTVVIERLAPLRKFGVVTSSGAAGPSAPASALAP
ncbi:MAG: hypothetical protein JWM93_3160 [Frankiales bacterium]|nr:hypothetical protein [Frankiales bacterium]